MYESRSKLNSTRYHITMIIENYNILINVILLSYYCRIRFEPKHKLKNFSIFIKIFLQTRIYETFLFSIYNNIYILFSIEYFPAQ